jgi:hypothetical protein
LPNGGNFPILGLRSLLHLLATSQLGFSTKLEDEAVFHAKINALLAFTTYRLRT